MPKEAKKKAQPKPKKPKLEELREQLGAKKQELSNLSPQLTKDLAAAVEKRSFAVQRAQSQAATNIKSHDRKKKEAVAAAGERFKSYRSELQKDYDQTTSDAKAVLVEGTKTAKKELEAECDVARDKFNEPAEGIFKSRVNELELADKSYKKKIADLKSKEIEARREANEEIDGLETQIKFEVSKQKKAINKKTKDKVVEAPA